MNARKRIAKLEAEAFALLGERAAVAIGLGDYSRLAAIDARLSQLRALIEVAEEARGES